VELLGVREIENYTCPTEVTVKIAKMSWEPSFLVNTVYCPKGLKLLCTVLDKFKF
jgi:hypothetical protein